MSLVDYSDSEGSEKETTTTKTLPLTKSRKRKWSKSKETELPPLPDTFYDLYASTARTSTQDDPALHRGRQRVTPHVEGNWPTHVYIEWYPSLAESAILADLLSFLKKSSFDKGATIHSLLQSELGAAAPLHISLSRSLMLVTDQRQPFIDTLKQSFDKSGIRPIEISPTALKWVPNHENTRWFLVLQLSQPLDNNLNKLLRLSNHVAKSFGHPTLYMEPEPDTQPASTTSLPPRKQQPFPTHHHLPKRQAIIASTSLSPSSHEESGRSKVLDCTPHFHISIAWSLHSPPPDALSIIESLDLTKLRGLRLLIKAVKIKVGNAVTVFPLSEKPSETRGIIGPCKKTGATRK